MMHVIQDDPKMTKIELHTQKQGTTHSSSTIHCYCYRFTLTAHFKKILNYMTAYTNIIFDILAITEVAERNPHGNKPLLYY